MNSIQERARAYLARLPHSVAGQVGHTDAFKAAVALTKGFALSPDEAYPLIAEWNKQCLPPWREGELRHKLKSAASSSSQQPGYLLGDAIKAARDPLALDYETETENKARQRTQWPALKTLKPAGIRMIAELRGILPNAVDLAHRRGLLKGAMLDGHRCFIIHEGAYAQARRFDGKRFTLKNSEPIKAKNLPGSEGAFIGSSYLEEARHVLLVEGAIGLLEAYAALLLVNCPEGWTAIASTSASSRFARDPELLKRLAGRHVRIVADPDKAGLYGASTWLKDLESVGCTIDAMTVPDGYKDLGDLVRCPERHQETLSVLFQ